jgi:hypothetical protein
MIIMNAASALPFRIKKKPALLVLSLFLFASSTLVSAQDLALQQKLPSKIIIQDQPTPNFQLYPFLITRDVIANASNPFMNKDKKTILIQFQVKAGNPDLSEMSLVLNFSKDHKNYGSDDPVSYTLAKTAGQTAVTSDKTEVTLGNLDWDWDYVRRQITNSNQTQLNADFVSILLTPAFSGDRLGYTIIINTTYGVMDLSKFQNNLARSLNPNPSPPAAPSN